MQKCGCAREAVEKYGDMLYRISLLILKNTADAEDAVQETFIKYFTKAPEFTDADHEKAWTITGDSVMTMMNRGVKLEHWK